MSKQGGEIDANKVINKLTAQVADLTRQVAILEVTLESEEENEGEDDTTK